MFENIIPTSQKLTNTEVLGSLLKPEDINLKTDLDLQKVKVLCSLNWFSKRLKQNPESPLVDLIDTLELYKQLLCSRNRKSRLETIEGLKHIVEEEDNKLTSIMEGLKK